MSDYTYTPTPERPKLRMRHWVRYLGLAVLAIAIWGLTRIGKPAFTVDTIRRPDGSTQTAVLAEKLPKISNDPEYEMPDNDKSRLDILVMGIRGEDDSENGGLLTDTILLLSMDTKTGAAALTSIPRDLTVRVTDTKTEKINTAYIHNGLGGVRKLFSRIIGVYIDNVIVVDFKAFQQVVDALGGVTITLDQPFEEKQQWGYTFSLPKGENTLDGQQALYYARSRYGSSDFDRSRRQMQLIMAIRAKIKALDLTSDPIKALQLATAVRRDIETDLDIFDLGTIKQLISEGSQLERIKRYQVTPDNVLYEKMVNGIYELLPRGDTLAHIKEFFRTVLTDHPILLTPSPSPKAPAK